MNFSYGKIKAYMIKYLPYEIEICDVDFKRFNFLIKSMLQRASHITCVYVSDTNAGLGNAMLLKINIQFVKVKYLSRALSGSRRVHVSPCTLLIESFFRAITKRTCFFLHLLFK